MKTWDYYGKHDPYFGVLSSEEFRSARLDESARQRFFASGAELVDRLIALSEQAVGPVTGGVALDYGCGVGRLSRRLADRFRHVIAVDISPHMLDEARRNLAERSNVSFELATSPSSAGVDFLMSKIVFQHIAPRQGLEILDRLTRRLLPGGSGIIDLPVRYTGGWLRRSLRPLRALLPFGEPVIAMHVYDLAAVTAVLRNAGCDKVVVERTAATLFEKATVMFRRGSSGAE